MANAFQDFIQTELPRRPVLLDDGAPETLIVRKTHALNIPRNYEELVINEGEVVGMSGGTLQSVPNGGAGANPLVVSYTAGEDLSAYRAIVIDASGNAIYADPTQGNIGLAVGLTRTSALAAASISVQLGGIMLNNGWSFTPGPVYLGTAGVATQTAPTTGRVLQIGVATGANTMLINIQQPILRSS